MSPANARTYAVRPVPKVNAFEAVATPSLPDGTKRAERPSYDLALAVARLWRLEHGGRIEARRK